MKLRLLFALAAAALFHGAADAAVRTVALTGQQAPGAPAGANFTHLYSTTTTAIGPVINNASRVAFAGQAMVGGGATSTGIWSDASGTLAAVARSGTQAPGTPVGVNYATLKNPLLNDAGRSSFDATVNTAAAMNAGIWSDSGSALNLVARKGSAAPGAGAGVNFATLFSPSINDSGQTTFRAQMSGPGVIVNTNDIGIWADKPGGLTLMARGGSQAPGVPAGVNYDHFPLPPILINSAGQIAFRGFLIGPGVTAGVNRIGIWAERAGAITLVAREGADADFDGADFLTWQRGLGRSGTGLPNNGDANADGNVNAADLAVWRTKFGTTPASFAAVTVPEPAALALGIFAATALTCISRDWRFRPS